MARLEDDDSASASVERSVDQSGSAVINIAGELDIATVPEVEAQLAPMIAKAPKSVVFDLSALDFMDSSGIAMLLRAAERTGSVEVRNPSNTVRRIILATGLSEVLRIDP
jgi:anti-anti-sigma factor